MKLIKLVLSIFGITIFVYSFLQMMILLWSINYNSLNFTFIESWIDNISKGLFNSKTFFIISVVIGIPLSLFYFKKIKAY